MSTLTDAPNTTTTGGRVPPSTANKVGYVLAILLALADLVSAVVPPTSPGEPGPPLQVLLVGAVFGVLTLGGAWLGWARRSRVGARVVAASRVLSLLLALPAFFVDGIPTGIVVLVSVLTVTAIAAVVLVLLRPRAA